MTLCFVRVHVNTHKFSVPLDTRKRDIVFNIYIYFVTSSSGITELFFVEKFILICWEMRQSTIFRVFIRYLQIAQEYGKITCGATVKNTRIVPTKCRKSPFRNPKSNLKHIFSMITIRLEEICRKKSGSTSMIFRGGFKDSARFLFQRLEGCTCSHKLQYNFLFQPPMMILPPDFICPAWV